MPTIAYPFIEVNIDTSALAPTAQRAPGVVAVVGSATTDSTDRGDAAANVPHVVESLDDAKNLFGKDNNTGDLEETQLYSSLATALAQSPRPSKIYGVKITAANYADGLSALGAVDDVTFVSLADEPGLAPLDALKTHVEGLSADGYKRIGVGMVDPATPKSATYVTDVMSQAMTDLKSGNSRMVMVAARGATGDAATAAMAAIAGHEPHVSPVLKRVQGVKIPAGDQFTAAEIKGLSEQNIIPLIDPALVPGEGIHFAEGRAYTTNFDLLYVDIVRTLDDIEYRLKAGLIGSIGDARITKAGMTRVKTRVEGILGPLKRRAVIDDFAIDIPVLNILNMPQAAWTATDESIVTTARAERTVPMFLTVKYGPAVHRLKVTLQPTF